MATPPFPAGSATPAALKPTAADTAADALTAITSLIDVAAPGLGSVFGMLVGQVIPGLHRQRVTEYLTRLAARLRRVESGLASLEEIVRAVSETHLALIEDGAVYAARATTSERIDAIVALVAGGITANQERAAADRRVLRTLGDLDEVELETLRRLAEWCGAGMRGSALTDRGLAKLLVGDREDSEGWGAYQLAFARLEALLLATRGAHGDLVTAYPTTAGELLLHRAGLHPAPDHLFKLARLGNGNRPTRAGRLQMPGQ